MRVVYRGCFGKLYRPDTETIGSDLSTARLIFVSMGYTDIQPSVICLIGHIYHKTDFADAVGFPG